MFERPTTIDSQVCVCVQVCVCGMVTEEPEADRTGPDVQRESRILGKRANFNQTTASVGLSCGCEKGSSSLGNLRTTTGLKRVGGGGFRLGAKVSLSMFTFTTYSLTHVCVCLGGQ